MGCRLSDNTGGIPVLRLFAFGGLVILICAIVALLTGSGFFKLLTLVVGLAVIGLYALLHRSAPRRTGTLQVPGLQEQVDVYADDRGVRHIYANNLHDLYMAQGYITAQDRLWTMDLHRRVASGRLAEMFGPEMVELDQHFRTLGMHRAAAASILLHSRETSEALAAYAEGVNAFIAERRPPMEYSLLRCHPEAWTSSDCLLLGKYAAYYLGGNWNRELFRTKVTQLVGAEKAAELFPTPPDADLLHMLETAHLPDLDRLLDMAALTLHETSGANGWVVGGSRTRSGAPILSNDPHLMAGNPAIWYQCHLVGPSGLDVTGATFPGIPGILLGHNREIAWGTTNLSIDCQDVFVEQANPANGHEYRYGDRWEKAECIVETIRIRGKANPIQHEVLITKHGPLIARGESTALALKWPALEPAADLDTFLAINRARSWPEFRSALAAFSSPAQQFFFAGKDGTIAGKAAGKIPVRLRGDGQTPVPGWTGQCEWTGFIPFDDLPELVNPPEGFITSVDFQGELSPASLPPYHTLFAAERLRGATDLTAEKMQLMQTGCVNYHARSLLQILLGAIQEGLRQGAHPESLTDPEKRAMLLLSEWNCCEGVDSAAALLWHQWYLFLVEGIFRPQMGLDLFDYFVASGQPVQVTDRLAHHTALGGSSLWVEAEGENSLSRIALRSFRRAVGYLSAKYGPSPERWRWGKEHTIMFRHPLSSLRPWLRHILDLGPFALGGSEIALNRPRYSHLRPFQVTTAATWRQVVDLGQLEESRDVCAPGQCGHPLSPHYADQLAGWLKGETHVQIIRHKLIQALPCLRLKP